jgi:uncharacterized delta-60 repeat protein
MKKITFLAAMIIAATTLNAQNGVLDNTFGTNGRVITDISAEENEARDIVIQPDGKIVVAGRSIAGIYNQFALARYNTNGSLDNTFGSGGLLVTNVSAGDDVIRGMALQPDGKIVVVGYAGVANEYLAIVRYNTNGTLDNTFATNGIDSLLIIDNPGDGDRSVPNDVKIQSDGKIVVAGLVKNSVGVERFAIVRYNTNGTLDASFGSGGKQIIVYGAGDGELESLAIQTDGKIVIAGHYDNGGDRDIYVGRINQFGMDNSFGTNGNVTYDFGSGDDEVWTLALQNDGKIVVAGNVSNGSDKDFGLLRYDASGVLDNTFGTAGVVTTELGANVDDYPLQAIMQPDNKILVAGVQFGTTQDLVIARYNANGTLDNTFGTNGLVIEDINNTDQIAFDIALQTDGKIVITGVSDGDFMTSRYTSGLVGIEDIVEVSSFNIYPNPVKNQLTITAENEKINNIKIMDVTGKILQVFEENPTTINVADLTKGFYLLQIQTDKGIATKRFIKE